MAQDTANLGIVGATSLFGRELLELLDELGPRPLALRLLSERVSGSEQPFRGADLEVEALSEGSFRETKVVIFCPGASRARRWIPAALAAGAGIVDLSSASRLDESVPLVVEKGSVTGRHLAVPGAFALLAHRVLQPLRERAGLARVDATFLVPASGTGARGVRELSRQTGSLLGSKRIRSRRFPHRLAFNVIPEVMGFDGPDDRSERAFALELRRLLGLPALAVAATALRAPLFFGLLATMSVTLERGFTVAEASEAFARAAGLKLLDAPASHLYPMPSLATGDVSVHVGRLRSDLPGHLQLIAAADPLRLVGQSAAELALSLL
ncbi:MAG: aspartate-semialdehyde dehydrogenase [Deltaproteobacteria bacterium]